MLIEDAWQNNVFVTFGDIAHEKVDSGYKVNYVDKKAFHNVEIFSEKKCINGIVDDLQFVRNEEGYFIKNFNGNFDVEIVEHKVNEVKNEHTLFSDKMQLLAQKICVDEMFECDSMTYFYYTNQNKKIKINFLKEDYDALNSIIEKMKFCFENQIIPDIDSNKFCSGCSLSNFCLPETHNKKNNVRQNILRNINEDKE